MAGDTPSPEEKVQTTVYITRGQKKWLAQHDEINLSAHVRRLIGDIRDTDWESEILVGSRPVDPEAVEEIERVLNNEEDDSRTSAGENDG